MDIELTELGMSIPMVFISYIIFIVIAIIEVKIW